jgi:glycosyltransferase involved in cell wall biosynthesis
MKVAFCHDWLTGMRGGEKVLEALCQLYPDSTIFTLLHKKGSVSPVIEQMEIKTSFIQKFPLAASTYRCYLPFFPTAIELFNLEGFDLIISSSHCVAKGAIIPQNSLHICYCHTPMRYAWNMYYEYFNKQRLGLISRMIIPFFINYLRMWDVTSSNRVDYFIANSKNVTQRIKKFYSRSSVVIHPPIDTNFFQPGEQKKDFFLIVSALAPYKKIPLAIEAFNQLKKPLKIVGIGSEFRRLKRMAKSNIEFLGWISNEELLKLYQQCQAFIFPGEEDFGICPLEAQACGSPVVAFARGGVLETLIDGETGVLFNEPTVEALIEAIDKVEKISFNKEFIRHNALKFSKDKFKQNISEYINECLEKHNKGSELC